MQQERQDWDNGHQSNRFSHAEQQAQAKNEFYDQDEHHHDFSVPPPANVCGSSVGQGAQMTSKTTVTGGDLRENFGSNDTLKAEILWTLHTVVISPTA